MRGEHIGIHPSLNKNIKALLCAEWIIIVLYFIESVAQCPLPFPHHTGGTPILIQKEEHHLHCLQTEWGNSMRIKLRRSPHSLISGI